MMNNIKRAVVRLYGTVQGVGFRPFVYKLALRYNLNGYVLNDGQGVFIEVEGKEENIENFIYSLNKEKPPLSRIFSQSIEIFDELKNFCGFIIQESKDTVYKEAFISPDISVCEDCLKEMFNPEDRRYLYPFINCTNCGPRFSIIESLPYDRKNTSMKTFKMCQKCEEEYNNPLNRRFHAQTNACSECGPQIYLYTTDKTLISMGIDAIKKVANLLISGNIVAIKGIGGFHLVCDATNDFAVKQLRERKKRFEKPFAVMFKDIDSIKRYAYLNSYEEAIILSSERPIVIVEKIKNTGLSEYVAPYINKIGVFLPYSPLHHLLFSIVDRPLVMTSANLSEEPIVKDNEEAFSKLSNFVDYIMIHDRDIINRVDDSVVFCVEKKKIFIRIGRGYAPLTLKLPFRLKKNVLAVGGNQKVTVSVGFDDKLIVSQYIGDLETFESQNNFLEIVDRLLKIYNFKPDIIVSDMHPNYFSTKWAERYSKENNIKHLKIQHHYAHALSVMVENNIKDEKVLAVCWDGTGYGLDGNVWGGEFLIVDHQGFERVFHFKNFKLIGGEKAIKEPRRVALSILFDIFGEDIKNMNIPTTNTFSNTEIKNLYKMWEKGINSPYTSSAGRLFDAVASITGLIQFISYEGQAGMIMEGLYDEKIKDSYDFILDGKVIDYRFIIEGVLKDKDKPVRAATKFINTMCNVILEISQIYKLPVVISGGVFQNKVLISKLLKEAKSKKLKLYTNTNVPPNDSCISVGQVSATLKMVK